MATLLQDTFTAADGTLLRGHTADVGGLWRSVYYDTTGFTDRDIEIRSGTARAETWDFVTSHRHYNESVMPTSDYDVQLDIEITGATTTQFEIELFARADGVENSIHAYLYHGPAGTSAVEIKSNGDWIFSGSITPANPVLGAHTLRLSLAGDICSLYYDDVLVASGDQTTSAFGAASGVGNVGFSIGNNWTSTPDEFRVDNFLVTGSATAPAFWTNLHGQSEVA